MTEMQTYPEMNAVIKVLLREDGSPHVLYAAQRIEELERKNAKLTARIAELEERNAQLQKTLGQVRGWIQDFCGDIYDYIRGVQGAEPGTEPPARAG